MNTLPEILVKEHHTSNRSNIVYREGFGDQILVEGKASEDAAKITINHIYGWEKFSIGWLKISGRDEYINIENLQCLPTTELVNKYFETLIATP